MLSRRGQQRRVRLPLQAHVGGGVWPTSRVWGGTARWARHQFAGNKRANKLQKVGPCVVATTFGTVGDTRVESRRQRSGLRPEGQLH